MIVLFGYVLLFIRSGFVCVLNEETNMFMLNFHSR